MTADIQDAFGNVPHRDLIHIVQRQLPTTESSTGTLNPVANLIQRIVHSGPTESQNKGISQGGSLSPLLLDWLLHHRLDANLNRLGLGTHYLRYADDILLLCRNPEEAEEALLHLRRILRPLGMRLKGHPDHHIADLTAGETACWLGLGIQVRRGAIAYRPTEAFHEELEDCLWKTREKADGILRIPTTIVGTLDQMGMCYEHVDRRCCLRRIRQTVQRLGIQSLPDARELERHWEVSAAQFQCQRDLLRTLRERNPAGGERDGVGFAERQPPRLLCAADIRPAAAGRAAESRSSGPIILTVSTSRTSEGSRVLGYVVQID